MRAYLLVYNARAYILVEHEALSRKALYDWSVFGSGITLANGEIVTRRDDDVTPVVERGGG